MKTHWWKFILIALLTPVFCIAVFRFYYQAEFNRRVKALAEEGYPVSLEDLEKAYVLPEGVQNAADIYIEAFSHYQEPNEPEKNFLPYCGNYTLPDDLNDIPDEVIEAISSFLEKNETTLELLNNVGQVRDCLWPKKRDGILFMNEHYGDIRNAAKLLQTQNLYFAKKQRPDLLCESLKQLAKLSKTLKTQACLLDHLVGNFVKSHAIQSLNESLNQITFNDQCLVDLQNEFSGLQDLDDFSNAFVIDRVCMIGFWRLPDNKKGENEIAPPSKFLSSLGLLTGITAKDSNLSLDYLEGYIAASKEPPYKRAAAFAEIEDQKNRLSLLHVHLKDSLISMARINNINTRLIGSLRCAETALAIERYRLRKGSIPDSVEQLVPEFIAEVPREPFDNQVLRYIRHDVGYTVYTIGEDGVDNGGLSKEQMKEKTGKESPEEFDWPFTVRRQEHFTR